MTDETHETHITTETHETSDGGRTPETIAAEIKAIQRQNKKIMLAAAIEIGRYLLEAKSIIPHGQFAAWLTRAVNYSERTAYYLMRICEEYGPVLKAAADDSGKTSPFAGLQYTQAIALLAIPAEERAEFISALDLENITIQELKQAIAAHNQARAEKEALKIELASFQRAVEFLRDRLQTTKAELDRRIKQNWREQGDVNKLKQDLKAMKDETKFGQRIAELEQQRNEAVIRLNSAKADAQFELIVKGFDNLYKILHDIYPADPDAFALYVLKIDRFLWKMSQGLKRLESEAAFHSLKLAKQAAAQKAAEILAAEEKAEATAAAETAGATESDAAASQSPAEAQDTAGTTATAQDTGEMPAEARETAEMSEPIRDAAGAPAAGTEPPDTPAATPESAGAQAEAQDTAGTTAKAQDTEEMPAAEENTPGAE